MEVVLPPKDDTIAPGIFNQGTPGPRWFDFSNAPDVKGFDSSTCTVDVSWGGKTAFRMEERERNSNAGAFFRGCLRFCDYHELYDTSVFSRKFALL